MKNHIKAFLAAAALTLPMAAQEFRTSYFSQTSDTRHEMNPALLDHGYVTMPLFLGYANAGTIGNVGLKNFIYDMEPDWQGYGVEGRTKTTFMHPGVDAASFLGDLKDNNRFGVNLKYQLLGVAFKGLGGYNVVELNLRSQSNVSVPKTLFEFMKTPGERTDYTVSDLGFRTENYVELGLGHSHRINDKWTVGAKLKLLFGLAYADLTADHVNLHLADDYWHVDGDVQMTAALMNTRINYDYDPEKVDPETGRPRFDDLGDFEAGLSGFGIGIDVGAAWQVLPDLQLSASLTDLGFMHWNNTNRASSAGEWTFDGFDEDVYIGGVKTGTNELDDQLDALRDDLEDIFAVYDDGKKSVNKALAATLHVGADYTLPAYRKLHFGFLHTSRFAGKYSWHQGMLTANVRPVKWFEASLNGAVSTTGVTAGFLADFHAKHFNFFIGVDQFLSKLSSECIPLSHSNSNLTLGISFPL